MAEVDFTGQANSFMPLPILSLSFYSFYLPENRALAVLVFAACWYNAGNVQNSVGLELYLALTWL